MRSNNPPKPLHANKQEVINSLFHIYGNLLLGNTLIGFSDSIDWKLIGTTTYGIHSPSVNLLIDLKPIFGTTTSLKKDQPTMVDEFQKMLKRAAVAESYEAIILYGYDTGQMDILRAEGWYQFARILRNTSSHRNGGMLNWPNDLTKKGITSITWHHLTFDQSMAGTPLVFHDAEVLKLILEEIDTVEKKLK